MNECEVFTPAKVTANSDGRKKSELENQWKLTDWTFVNETVNRTQTRIAKATISKDWNLVRELQRMLVGSHHAKLLAVRKVTTNTGHKTAGVDGIIWDTPSVKMANALILNKGKYKAKPLKRVDIDKGKGDGSTRPLGIPTMYDRAMQCLYSFALDPVAETLADSNSYGFRKGRGALDAGEQIFACISAGNSAPWVLDADLKGFFDNISHEWLLEHIPMDKAILREFLKAGVVIKGKLHPTNKGTPQGGIISPIIANMALDGLEEHIKDKYWRYDARNGQRKPNRSINYKNNIRKINIIRYADDFVITGDAKETCEEVKEHIKPFLEIRGVELSESKTRIVNTNEGFDFLGWTFRKFDGKLLVKPSKKSIEKHLEEIRTILDENKTIRQSQLVIMLNRKNRGWRNYHKHSVARDAFEKVDHEVFQALWKWAIRRHKGKGKIWVKEKYWHRIANDNWVFYDDETPLGKSNQRLMKVSNQKIIRHIKVQMDKNPYIDTEYFKNRKLELGAKNLSGIFREIWRRQKGICPVCGEVMEVSNDDDRDVHHVVPKAWGGSDKPSNLLYLHEGCHDEYHSANPVRRNCNIDKRTVNQYIPLIQNDDWKLLLARLN